MEIILILVTLASTFVGTFWKTDTVRKALVFLLAVVASGFGIIQQVRRAQAEAFTRRVLMGFAERAEPSKAFEKRLELSLEKLRAAHGLGGSRSVIQQSGQRVYEFVKAGNTEQGVE